MIRCTSKLLTWRKALSQRIAASVVAVFMLQIVAAGFCMPSVSAAPVEVPHQMEVQHEMVIAHCDTTASEQTVIHHHSADDEHVCVHCDLPDLSITADKESASLNNVVLELLFVAYQPIVQVAVSTEPRHLLPPLRTSLYTFDLNQRFRV